MTTKLERTLKREIDIDGVAHTLTIDERGLKVTKKGSRNGQGCTWSEFKSIAPDSNAAYDPGTTGDGRNGNADNND
jgi:hypothetical protein